MADVLEKNVFLNIPFSTAETAALACEVLSVDKELKGSKIRREISTEGSHLIINFYGTESKTLRVAVSSMLRNILLVAKTLNQFQ